MLKSNISCCQTLLAGMLLVSAAPSFAATDRTVLFLDGARLETTVSTRNGVAAVALQPGMVPGSLRIEPLKGAVIDRVTVVPPPAKKDAQRERRILEERRDALADRLAALAVKEDVFKSAAKSQSGRAPKRTKTNPEPLATIRQGTDYAVAQLEAVYRSRRVTERERSQIDKRLAALAGDPVAVGSLAQIALHGGDQVRVSYLVNDRKWSPQYDLHLLGKGESRLTVRSDGRATAVVPGSITSSAVAKEMPLGNDGVLGQLPCSVAREEHLPGAQPQVRTEITCSPLLPLPAGPAACYAQGKYLGTLNLPGITPGVPVSVVCGAFTGFGAGSSAPTAN